MAEPAVPLTPPAMAPTRPETPASRLGWLSLVPLGLFVLALRALLEDELPLVMSRPWVPSLGIDLAFHIDGLALQLLLLITGVGTLVFVYAAGYMAGDPHRRRLFVLLFAFMGAMIGCVSTGDLLVLFVFWELTSIISFMLVGYKHEYEATRKSAQQALMVTGGGGLLLLAGVLLLGQIAGTYSIQDILRGAPSFQDHPLLPPALACLFLGAFTKSAQFPFHFWLPNAMAAPTPVSAYLHSATMVKLGVYLLARLHPAFGELWVWQLSLVGVGGFTSAWAMVLALRERDLKRILAWSTVSALGTLVMLIGLPGEGAATATAAFLLAHALYKAPLFFVAGNLDLCTGTRSIDRLAGLARTTPWTAAAALLAGLSMSGIPLSFGFVAKDVIKAANVELEPFYTWVAYTGMFVSAASVAVAGVAAIRIFWHSGGEPIPEEVREASPTMRLPPLIIAALGILFGLFPGLLDSLIAASAKAMRPPGIELAPSATQPAGSAWSAFAMALALGVGIFLTWDRLHAAQAKLRAPTWLSSIGWYERKLRAIPAAAGAVMRTVQHGALTGYTAAAVAFVLASTSLTLVSAGMPPLPAFGWPSIAVGGACLALVLVAVAVCVVRDSFVLLLTSGLVGLGNALLFLFLGAPDVAFTQFAVEVAFVVVIAAILIRVRRLDLEPPPPDRVWPRALLALGAGTLVAGLLLAAVSGSHDPMLPEFFAERSVPDAHGRNVVNVILVDFRATDTLGEISVVAAAFLAAAPLFRLLRPRGGATP